MKEAMCRAVRLKEKLALRLLAWRSTTRGPVDQCVNLGARRVGFQRRFEGAVKGAVVGEQPPQRLLGAFKPHSSCDKVVLQQCRQQPHAAIVPLNITSLRTERHLSRPDVAC